MCIMSSLLCADIHIGLKPVTTYAVTVQPRFGNAQQQAALTVSLNFTTLRPGRHLTFTNQLYIYIRHVTLLRVVYVLTDR